MKYTTVTPYDDYFDITLNRPEALNSLTLGMTRDISGALSKFCDDTSMKAFFIHGAGGRAFCAGGDLKGLYESGVAFKRNETDENLAAVFFEEEYELNKQIKSLKKPYISYLNGITMGGGYGVSGHGSHLIATPLTKFAMPEVNIGFFPDIGATYNLNKCPNHIGTYLAMTGAIIKAEDMVYAELADAIIDPEEHDFNAIKAAIMSQLSQHDDVASYDDLIAALSNVIKDMARPIDVNQSILHINEEKIVLCFGHSSVNEIVDALKSDGSDWANETLEALHYACPFSVHIAFEQMQRVKTMNFDEVMQQDLILAHNFIKGEDLYEGIRETVIDKTKQPKWKHQSLSDVTKEEVDNYFMGVNLL